MEKGINMGLQGVIEKVVNKEDTAKVVGSGEIEVLATPVLIALMENASVKALNHNIDEGFSTVGININVDHIAATPIGMKVTAKSKLTRVEGKKLYFDVEAYDENKKIGEGKHIRYIVNINRFMERLNSNF